MTRVKLAAMRRRAGGIMLAASAACSAPPPSVKLEIARREPVLGGKAFGNAGAYEKLVGTVKFALDPSLPYNQGVVDLALAPRNADGMVTVTADFYLLKPVDPAKGNGRLFYEVGNRGGKGMLVTFQKASGSTDGWISMIESGIGGFNPTSGPFAIASVPQIMPLAWPRSSSRSLPR